MPDIDTMPEVERTTRIRVTFAQLEAFEASHHELVHAAIPEDIDPLIRQVEIDAQASVAAELREELTELAGGRYVCTARHPYDPATFTGPEGARIVHPAAEEQESASDEYSRWHCPRCGHGWTQELPQ